MSSSSPSKRRSASLLGLRCGCKDSKSVSVSSPPPSSDAKSSTATATTQIADTLTLTSPSTSASFSGEDADAAPPPQLPPASLTSTPSFSGLLRQLNELEQDVISWGRCTPPLPSAEEANKRRAWHRRSSSEGGGCGGRQRVEESVAVVKETEDPLGEFRRSMLQMIVEKEIVDGEELRELLRRFLALNSPRHHNTILRAFAEIWEEVFSGYENTPDLLPRPRRSRRNPTPPLPPPRRL